MVRLLIGIALLVPALALAADAPDPRAGWRFAFSQFPIGAWSPPADTEAEYKADSEAGFNLVMSPRYALPDRALELAQKYHLGLMVDTYTPNDKPWGGTASQYTPHPSHHPATLPELQWLHARYGKHPALAGYLLGDDYGAVPAELVETTQFLRQNAPHLIPWICQNVMSAESLAKAGNPIQDPQIYPTLYQKDWPAAEQALQLCRQLQVMRQGCLRWNLIPWPMFNVCEVESDSLVRFQVYASLAFGAEGIWYFTYKDGLQQGCGYTTDDEVRAHLLPTWQVAAEANRRVATWGPKLLGDKTAGLFASGSPVTGCSAPAPGKLVEAMADDLLVGVRLKDGAAPLVMVVDRRVDKAFGKVPERTVEVQFVDAVTGYWVLEAGQPQTVTGHTARLTLPGGGGALLALQGKGLEALCREIGTAAPTGDRKIGPDGLIMSISFDEGQGEIAHDQSGARNDLWLHRTDWVPGHSGQAIGFAGSARYAELTEAFLPTDKAMSVAVWVRPVYPETGYAPIVLIGSGGCDRFEFGLGPDNLYPVISDQMTHSGGALYVSNLKALLPPGVWGHIAVCAGPAGATTYINGRAVAHSDYVGKFDFMARQASVGVRGTEGYDGELDDLRVWNRCLTAEEVAALAKP